MRHNSQKKSLGRESQERKALLRNLADSLVLAGGITTTLAKARVLRRYVEPVVTKARKNTLAARRDVARFLFTDAAVKELMEQVAPRYADRAGGYTRIIKIGSRGSDRAQMARIEFV
jgi:large subunit ribosomal protein L17